MRRSDETSPPGSKLKKLPKPYVSIPRPNGVRILPKEICKQGRTLRLCHCFREEVEAQAALPGSESAVSTMAIKLHNVLAELAFSILKLGSGSTSSVLAAAQVCRSCVHLLRGAQAGQHLHDPKLRRAVV